MTNEANIPKTIGKVLVVGGRNQGKTLHATLELIEENTKLKSEIERLKGELRSEREFRANVRIELLDRKTEIEQLRYDLKNEREWIAKFKTDYEQLKSKLEQLKIPCIHGYDKTKNEIGETLIFCEHTDNWMNVTLGECIGNCEAEER